MAAHLTFLITMLLWTALPLLAQPGTPASASQPQTPLTIDEAVRRAWTANASLLATRDGIEESTARLSAAKAAFLPTVAVSESWQRGNQPVFVFGSLLSARRFGAEHFAIDALNRPDAVGLFRSSLSVEQLLFDGGRTTSSVDAAAHQRDLAAAMSDKAAADLAVAVTDAYGRLLTAQAEIKAARAAEASGAEDLARAERRRDAGLLTEGDVLALRVHLAEMAERRIAAASRAAIAQANLNRAMGAPLDEPRELQEPPMSSNERPGAASRNDVPTRPEVRVAVAAAALAEDRRRGARAAWAPQVAAQAGYELAGTRFPDRASSWVVGGTLRWSFSTGGSERADMRAAAAAVSRARHELEAARSAAALDVIGAQAELASARARIEVGRTTVEAARESERILRERFGAGMASVTDLLRASSAVLDAEVRRTSAVVDSAVAAAQLSRALGRTGSEAQP